MYSEILNELDEEIDKLDKKLKKTRKEKKRWKRKYLRLLSQVGAISNEDELRLLQYKLGFIPPKERKQ